MKQFRIKYINIIYNIIIKYNHLSTVHKSDGKVEKTVPVSGGFGVQRSVAPARGEELEQIMSRV